MIQIKECGHSVETSGRWFQKYPERCYYCEYLQKHPRKDLYKGNSTTERRLAQAEHMKRLWKAKKEGVIGQ